MQGTGDGCSVNEGAWGRNYNLHVVRRLNEGGHHRPAQAWGQGDQGALDQLMPLPQTVMRDWRLERAWLARELQGDEKPSS